EELRKKYHDAGLRLIVINIDEVDNVGQCKKLPWKPWRKLCKPELADELGITNVPQSFAWSWQGELLVAGQKDHIEEVENALQDYFKKNPRVLVEATDDEERPDPKLQAMVESELNVNGKMSVVVAEAERARLRQLQKESFSAIRRDDQRCELGTEMSANVLLKVMRYDDSMLLKLQEIGSKCQKSVIHGYSAKTATTDVRFAIKKLTRKLTQRPVKLPAYGGNAKAQLGGARVIRQTDTWDPTKGRASKTVVNFVSEPPGAFVMVNGESINCPKTPCKRAVAARPSKVSFSLTDYETTVVSADLSGQPEVRATLVPTFGTLNLSVNPRSLPIFLDGQPLPLKSGTLARRLSLGQHILEHKDRCYTPEIHEFEVKSGETIDLDLSPNPHVAALEIESIDERSDALRAKVLADGAEVGNTYDLLKIPICTKEVQVLASDGRSWFVNLPPGKVQPKSQINATATLSRKTTRGRVSELKFTAAAQVSASPNAAARALALVQFASQPPGATVFIDGQLACNSTPCSRPLIRGPHHVKMVLQDYVSWTSPIQVDKDDLVNRPLTPDFATVSVKTTPPGLPVRIDGDVVGNSPILDRRVAATAHVVEVGSADGRTSCFQLAKANLELKRGDDKTVNLNPEAVPSAIEIIARDEQQNDVIAEVWADGDFIGQTPNVHRLPKCTQWVEVRHPELASTTVDNLDLQPKAVSKYSVTLKGSALKVSSRVRNARAMVRIDGRFAGLTPFDKSLKPGNYRVEIDDPCYVKEVKQVRVVRGRRAEVQFRSQRSRAFSPDTCNSRGLLYIDGLTPDSALRVNSRTEDARTIAAGNPLAVATSTAINISIVQPNRSIFTTTLQVQPGQAKRIRPDWQLIRFTGARPYDALFIGPSPSLEAARGSKLTASARRLLAGKKPIGLSPGIYRIQYLREGKPPINGVVSITARDIRFSDGPWEQLLIERTNTEPVDIALPLLLVPKIAVSGASSRLLARRDAQISASGTWLPSGEPHRVVIESPRHVRQTVRVQGEPGETVQLKVDENDMQLHPLWEKYQKTSTMRTVGWSMAGLGAVSAITTGVLGYLTSDSANTANTALQNYAETTDLVASSSYQRQAQSAQSSYEGYLAGTIATGLITAGSIATAIYLLIEYPNSAPPGLRDTSTNWQFSPWFAPGSAGATMQMGF
ncbi:MAG: PEGA domain-containing protein, partial [Myxococcota bacterium]|nr:PEGA domain-containing protein [Myxococcota bacterium]